MRKEQNPNYSRLIVLFLCLLIISSLGCERQATIHAILCGDTLDETTGSAKAANLAAMQKRMQTAARSAGMRLNLQILKGNEFTEACVNRAIAQLNPSQDDAVIFYTTSHGYRLPSTPRPWPLIALQDGRSLDQYAVFERLYFKRPRLLLVMADCCNLVPPLREESARPDRSSPNSWEAEGYETLFAHSRGALIASSCQPGQYSYSYRDRGSHFTIHFLESLQNEAAGGSTATWGQVMQSATERLPTHAQEQQYQKGQHEIYESPADVNE